APRVAGVKMGRHGPPDTPLANQIHGQAISSESTIAIKSARRTYGKVPPMNTPRQDRYQERLLRVLNHIQANLDGDLTLAHLAGIACISPFHFHRVFHALMGETVGAHIRRLGLERAALALRDRTCPITEAAFDAGYESVEAFSRAFRAAFGSAPSAYRRRRHCSNLIRSASGGHYHPDCTILRLLHPLAIEQENPMDVRYETIGDIPVAANRHIGPYEEITRAFTRLEHWGSTNNMFGGARWVLAIYHHDPSTVAPDQLRSDACVRVLAGFKGDGEIRLATLAAGRYDTLGAAWTGFIHDWAIKDGIEIDSPPCSERYLNTPRDVAPEDLLTDLYLPVKS
ncbi:MAG: AraC family transcriptional regulator, partial [Alphaproteobacteria bacterium]|nr:AraC family transcriptional regulator [Alphaproteobacteria bacterium]